jgi:hypothetical protein
MHPGKDIPPTPEASSMSPSAVQGKHQHCATPYPLQGSPERAQGEDGHIEEGICKIWIRLRWRGCRLSRVALEG